MDRRTLLRGAGLSLSVGFAGCTSLASDSGTSPDGKPDTVSSTEPETEHPQPTETSRSTETESRQTPNWGEGHDSSRSDWHVRPSGEPQHVPSPLSCNDSDVQRYNRQYEDGIAWGDSPGGNWQLRVGSLRYEKGSEVRIRLRNQSKEPLHRGSEASWALEVYTETGWQHLNVSVFDEPAKPVVDKMYGQHPGQIHEWNLTISAGELPGIVCPNILKGRHRFVYYGTLGGENTDLAISFDVY